jgi:hypothetical protein
MGTEPGLNPIQLNLGARTKRQNTINPGFSLEKPLGLTVFDMFRPNDWGVTLGKASECVNGFLKRF